ncbi:hypothetical protein PR202_ga04556 [Eleusine coracana subsp. coracana]|uniref:Calcium permeable stress-gated cation channel 1 n=1 Tax=Eleusine coracana subsp. coracana TaxID=191504 RepID=A0AAV5BQ69_ELECO|nr:hypothetical protein PR202_ga04556 [Eleusine coracana subsp. coracana]
MGSFTDIGVSAGINILSALGFLLAFAVLRIQPINDRVYFPKWYLKGTRSSPRHLGTVFSKFVNADLSTYLRFLNWMPAALKMPEPELIEHAGLDSAVYVRIYLLGLKIFVPIAVLAFAVLVPVNWTSGTLENEKSLSYDEIDKLSISNLGKGSKRFWAHIVMAYVFTFWTFYVLYHEYKVVTTMRLRFVANQNRRPDQYTVLVQNVPPDEDESVSEHVEHFFAVNHRDHYLTHQEDEERQKVITDPNSIMPAAFVSFKTRWGAAVCAQTQQTNDIERRLPFLKPLIERNSLKSIIQGFLPGIVLKIFLILLPTILMTMSKIEGHTSLSGLDRKTASKYYLFLFVNVFLGSVITGTAFQQLDNFIHQSANKIPEIVGESIPMKATFFMSYIMVDGWAGVAAEVLRLKPLVMFHIKNTFLVRTEHDREQAMDPGSLDFYNYEPRLQLYFLLGLVYAAITPILLPFIIVFFSLAYLVFRHQEAEKSTIALIPLPVLSIWFHYVCKKRFEPAFVKFPLQDAMVKDTLERAHDPTFNLREYLKGAYVHPVFQKNDLYELVAIDEEEKNPLVVTKRQSRMNTPAESKLNSSSGTNEGEFSRLPT